MILVTCNTIALDTRREDCTRISEEVTGVIYGSHRQNCRRKNHPKNERLGAPTLAIQVRHFSLGSCKLMHHTRDSSLNINLINTADERGE
jgi:hypothetical protein